MSTIQLYDLYVGGTTTRQASPHRFLMRAPVSTIADMLNLDVMAVIRIGRECGPDEDGAEGMCELFGVHRSDPNRVYRVLKATDPLYEDMNDGEVML